MKIDLKKHPTIRHLFVSTDGERVFLELQVSRRSHGYHTIKLNGKTVCRHVLVLETFKGLTPGPEYETRHLNGNPGDDRPRNLEWALHSVNAADMIRHGTSTAGERNARAKITKQKAKEIYRRRMAGEQGRSLAREFGISEGTICDIIKGRTWRGL